MKHNNPTISQDMQRHFNFKGESTGEVHDTIIPVYPILNNCNIVKSTSAVNATSTTIYTTPADKDFYLCGAQISTTKDATSTSTLTAINVYVENVACQILRLQTLTLTAQHFGSSINFNVPIKLTRGTTITITNATNVANIASSGTIYGYTVEVI